MGWFCLLFYVVKRYHSCVLAREAFCLSVEKGMVRYIMCVIWRANYIRTPSM